jgi:hypothetical protein
MAGNFLVHAKVNLGEDNGTVELTPDRGGEGVMVRFLKGSGDLPLTLENAYYFGNALTTWAQDWGFDPDSE